MNSQCAAATRRVHQGEHGAGTRGNQRTCGSVQIGPEGGDAFPGLVNDAESIAVGVDEDDEVVIWTGVPLVAGRAEPEQPLDLSLPIVGVEVEMHPAGITKRW